MVNFCEGLIAFVFYNEVNVLYFICIEGTCVNHYWDKKYTQKEKLGWVIITSSSLGVLKTKHLVCMLRNLQEHQCCFLLFCIPLAECQKVIYCITH